MLFPSRRFDLRLNRSIERLRYKRKIGNSANSALYFNYANDLIPFINRLLQLWRKLICYKLLVWKRFNSFLFALFCVCVCVFCTEEKITVTACGIMPYLISYGYNRWISHVKHISWLWNTKRYNKIFFVLDFDIIQCHIRFLCEISNLKINGHEKKKRNITNCLKLGRISVVCLKEFELLTLLVTKWRSASEIGVADSNRSASLLGISLSKPVNKNNISNAHHFVKFKPHFNSIKYRSQR